MEPSKVIPECSVCYEVYSRDRMPVSMPCGHSLCEVCFRRLTVRRRILCPQDKQSHIAELRPNYDWINHIEQLREANSEEELKLKASEEEIRKLSQRLQNCQQIYDSRKLDKQEQKFQKKVKLGKIKLEGENSIQRPQKNIERICWAWELGPGKFRNFNEEISEQIEEAFQSRLTKIELISRGELMTINLEDFTESFRNKVSRIKRINTLIAEPCWKLVRFFEFVNADEKTNFELENAWVRRLCKGEYAIEGQIYSVDFNTLRAYCNEVEFQVIREVK